MSIVSQGFFMLRRPRLPLDVLYAFNERAGNRPELFERELIRFFSQSPMLEALYVASPELYSSFTGLIEGRIKTGVDKLLKTLYKYLVRMTTRSTPYGLFAGCAVGEIGQETRIAFDEAEPFRKHVRLDMNYVAELADGLLQKNAIRDEVKFFPNTSLYPIGDAYRYVESALNNKKRLYVLASVDRNAYLDKVITAARGGATIRELADGIVSEDVSREEAEQFVDAIVRAQILVSELAATVTGEEFFFTIVDKLRAIAGAAQDLEQLNKIASLLQSGEQSVDKYREVESVLAKHFVTTGSKDLVQTDLFLQTQSCTINEKAIALLTKEYQNLACLGYRNPLPELDQFKKRFLARYEQREMPLLEVLDCETGIGYGDAMAGRADNLPLLDEMQWPEGPKPAQADASATAELRDALYQQSIAEKSTCICLTDNILNEFRKASDDTVQTPDSFYLFGNLIAGSQQEVDSGNFKFAFKAMGGPSGLKLIGRFCHGDSQLAEWAKKAVAEEEALGKDGVYAEVAHLPEARVGNVLMRPHLREFEIPYLAGSSMPRENQILPEDLMVSVSISGEVILRSKRLNKRVFPRLTNAHNFSDGLPVYRFLCELTYQQDYRYLGWEWGHLASNTFLPRVEYKHWILSRATWNIDKKMVADLVGSELLTVREWRVLRNAFNIPRFVQLRQGDSELLIDGDSDFAVEIVSDAIRKFDKVTLTEFPEYEQNGFLGKPGESYLNEILLPLLHKKEPLPTRQVWEQQSMAGPAVRRDFMTGSEWLYVKIYAGTRTADRLLRSVIKPFADRLMAESAIEKWFFIRYGDPDNHIRLRFYHGSDKSFWQIVLAELHALMEPYLANGTVHKIQLDTYKRELERYGHQTFEEVESIFFADSVATADLLNMLSGDAGEHFRWLTGLKGVDMLLNDLGFTLADKKVFAGQLRERFFHEFRGDTQLNIQLNNKYRQHTEEIRSFLDSGHDAENGIVDVIALLEKRSARIRASLAVILPRGEVSLGSFASSLVHMFLNRLFVSQQREHELVVYHYLKKYYESKLARREKVAHLTFVCA
ncbi:thiopeptide-type bacteriocin biosynthesis protein [Dyadobacter sp. BE34]|uniref:Thiopeptide-type bacteriocin biosynthesis protein n=1 Tax=Dyadobacter fermentans TaxID=94254 RepID=A0ABU1R675_9BACT|nr:MULTISPECIES: lantibiotic dehydratase [Dyadobacter]MDR6808906.1 thiopeptide-type bacteriocin biosynthesis protein [Dyadobacter fermentans]MDR7046649.1 thiopeptide-type bacteriocin biosynthesis protein [Dyadobacter sp. BE242]MDR7200963.1 thiopeptide-type bacteriocin biosynthesis protein [Dyadobacter sp. BE34]MDR7218923.1 thiopeptide-type bacteriocin biosynthesis protein [Dyadobacter sp. BE31]MDR7264867.1 thiopeptide-type bacteriocin biosynthesis protein [Dyadobacter sp. BE32]